MNRMGVRPEEVVLRQKPYCIALSLIWSHAKEIKAVQKKFLMLALLMTSAKEEGKIVVALV